MKTLKILLVIAAVIISGFSGELQTDGTKARVVVPAKFDGNILVDVAGGQVPCTPEEYGFKQWRFGFLQGHGTHGGKLVTEQSTWEILSCSTDPVAGINTSQVVGVCTVANGDTYTWTCIMFINFITMDVTLNLTITDGTGRYEGVTGEIIMTGGIGEKGILCSGEGFLSFPK